MRPCPLCFTPQSRHLIVIYSTNAASALPVRAGLTSATPEAIAAWALEWHTRLHRTTKRGFQPDKRVGFLNTSILDITHMDDFFFFRNPICPSSYTHLFPQTERRQFEKTSKIVKSGFGATMTLPSGECNRTGTGLSPMSGPTAMAERKKM